MDSVISFKHHLRPASISAPVHHASHSSAPARGLPGSDPSPCKLLIPCGIFRQGQTRVCPGLPLSDRVSPLCPALTRRPVDPLTQRDQQALDRAAAWDAAAEQAGGEDLRVVDDQQISRAGAAPAASLTRCARLRRSPGPGAAAAPVPRIGRRFLGNQFGRKLEVEVADVHVH